MYALATIDFLPPWFSSNYSCKAFGEYACKYAPLIARNTRQTDGALAIT